MPFSKTFSILLMLGTIPILLSSITGGTALVFFLYNAMLILLFIADLFLTPGVKELEVIRDSTEKLSLGAENQIIIKIRNNSNYLLNIEVTDEVPVYLKVKSDIVCIKAVPHQESSGSYFVMPEKRGEFTFGKVHLRYKGILRLCVKGGKFNLGNKYKVYPNLKDLRRYSFAALKKNQMVYGVKKTKAFGTGTEFESLKEYAIGDDYKKINWLATARSNKLIVNTYEPEKNQQIYIMLDSSRVMNSEIQYIKKLDYAINSAFLLAEIAGKKGDNFGLLVFDSEVKRFVKPGKGMAQFKIVAESLYNVEENFVSADYNGALMYLNRNHQRRSLLCIFTELFNTDEAWALVQSLKSVARRHIPLVITIKDMRLYEMANAEISDSHDVYLKSAAMKYIEDREKIEKIFSNSGIACIDVPPDKLSMEVVNKYLTMKSMLQI
jgi:uncharacterized protein (DUF58 family)